MREAVVPVYDKSLLAGQSLDSNRSRFRLMSLGLRRPWLRVNMASPIRRRFVRRGHLAHGLLSFAGHRGCRASGFTGFGICGFRDIRLQGYKDHVQSLLAPTVAGFKVQGDFAC